MSALTATSPQLSEEEYLAGELLSEVRHEYLAGTVHAMAGASDKHNYIAGNLFVSLHLHLRGKTCAPFNSDMKLRMEFGTGVVFYYPDLMVCCDPEDTARYYRNNPVLIVEILSPQTARVDQREKFLAYRTLPSLEVYVMVDQDQCRLILHRRANDWRAEFLSDPDALLTVPGLGWSVALREIYERTGLAG
jgi:Uma2 family endonuclease